MTQMTNGTKRVWRSDLSMTQGVLVGYVLGVPPWPAWIVVLDDGDNDQVLYQRSQRLPGGMQYKTPDGQLTLVVLDPTAR